MIKRFQILKGVLCPSDGDNSSIMLYINPNAAEKEELLARLPIDQYSLASAFDPGEIPRVEIGPDHLFLIWKQPNKASFDGILQFDVSSIGLFLSKEQLVVITEAEDARLYEGRHFIKINSVFDAMLDFLYRTIRHYLEHLRVIKQISRDLQEKINSSMDNDYLIQMFSLSESLIYYVNAINANNMVLGKLRNYVEKLGFSPANVELVDDLIIEGNQCYKEAEIYSSILSGLMDARGTLVNNNMNILIKNLTMLNIVFLPLNLIASIGGMSEYSMMTQGVPWWLSYSMFFVGMIVMGLLTILLVNRTDFGGITRGRFLRNRKR